MSSVVRFRRREMIRLIKQFHNNESGQDIIEYVLIAALIAVAAMATIPIVGSKVSNYWTNLNAAMS
jgi:Flp pilus assembly pilin Flp